MITFKLLILAMSLLGVGMLAMAIHGVYRHIIGKPLISRAETPFPFIFWPFAIFTTLMLLAGRLPVLFGNRFWFLDKVFALVAVIAAIVAIVASVIESLTV